MTKMLP